MSATRIGIDLGGTKIEGVLIGSDGLERPRVRIAAPRGSYDATLRAIADVVARLDEQSGAEHGRATVGIGVPGALSPSSGRVQNANSTWLNGRALDQDLAAVLGRPVRLANDANCLALSEARDGAGAGARTVLGIILGTGCGGGIVVDGRIVDGPRGTGGEWGHNPLPVAAPVELPGPLCWCGRHGCVETWLSGPGLAGDHERVTGERLSAEIIAERARSGDVAAIATLERHLARLARALAVLVNILDPDVVVLGGGLSKLEGLYEKLPARLAPHLFAEDRRVTLCPARWGDASGVRGAAWLW